MEKIIKRKIIANKITGWKLIARKIAFAVMCAAAAVVFAAAVMNPATTESMTIYVADSELLRLIPITVDAKPMSAENAAKYAIDRMIEGFDENPKIRRLIPKLKRCMTVKVKDNTAYVNITSKMKDALADFKSPDIERLTVYSIVNTLTSIDGIDSVRFTINKKSEKYFMGHMDMRDFFKKSDVLKAKSRTRICRINVNKMGRGFCGQTVF